MQIVHSSRRGSRDIEHLGSAHDGAGIEALKAVAAQRLVSDQGEFDLGLGTTEVPGGPLPITSSTMGHLCDGLTGVYNALGFAQRPEGRVDRPPGL